MTVLRVLIADDHPLVLEAVGMCLQRMPGVEVVASVASGREAIAGCQELSPHVAVLDYHMEGMDGAAATMEIKRRFPNVVVVGMSLHYDARQRMHQSGVDHFLEKPTVFTELPTVVEEIRNRLRTSQCG